METKQLEKLTMTEAKELHREVMSGRKNFPNPSGSEALHSSAAQFLVDHPEYQDATPDDVIGALMRYVRSGLVREKPTKVHKKRITKASKEAIQLTIQIKAFSDLESTLLAAGVAIAQMKGDIDISEIKLSFS